MIEGFKIPKVTFRIREGDTSDNEVACAIGGKWTSKTTDDFFKNKRVILFSLPGAFTPTCSSQQLPGFENNAGELKKLGIDEIGLDEMDRKILSVLIDKFEGGPVGLKSLAVAIGEDVSTIEDVYEPFLIKEGLLLRTARGRVVQKRGYQLMGKKFKQDQQGLFQ